MDVQVNEGEYKGKTLLGIYGLEGDTLRACYAPPGKGRPSRFASRAGTGVALYVYKRQKP